MEPEVKGYLYKETVAGFFRAWKLNEMHLGIVRAVNEMRIAGREMIIKKTGVESAECARLLEECVVTGLLCENLVILKNDSGILLYMVDTGGIFALEEAGLAYRRVSYTAGMDERISIYRKNIYLAENGLAEGEAANVFFYEKITSSQIDEKLRGATVLVDMRIAGEINIAGEVEKELDSLRKKFGARIYDIGNRKWLN
ncbi:MAG: hypothetical protein K6T80_07810 [Firmicutes bacterium]|nr:hypothetical protein [Bacillota bacterium]